MQKTPMRTKRQRLIKETLPKAWNKIIEEPDELLVDLIAETTERMCGYKPGLKDVSQFLVSHYDKFKIESFLETTGKTTQHTAISQTFDSQKHGSNYKEYNRQNLGPKGHEQVKDYLIPVIKLMRGGKTHNEAFKTIAQKLGVAYQTVNSQCTRTLDISTREFVDYVNSGYIVQVIRKRYPDKMHLIDQELGT